MVEQQNIKKESDSDKTKNIDLEIDLMDIFRKIIIIRKTIYKSAVVGLLIGIVVAISIPKQYTVKVTLSPEMGASKGNNGLAGIAASFLGSEANSGGGADALNASLSADIISSTPFLLELMSMNVLTTNKGDKMTFKTYLDNQSSPWWNYLIGIPSMVVNGIKSLFMETEIINTENRDDEGIIELTKDVSKKIKLLKKKISATVDKNTAITEISVTLQDPKTAALVADSVVRKLQNYIIDYRTSKAKEDCAYLEKLCKERQQEYYIAQKKYAIYLDTHDNLILNSERAEQDRLQNDMNLAYQVYSQVSTQLQVARAKVQEVKPVFAVLEPAVKPLLPSGFGLKMYVLLFVFMAMVGTTLWILFIGKIKTYLK